jgi:hypothetical protein
VTRTLKRSDCQIRYCMTFAVVTRDLMQILIEINYSMRAIYRGQRARQTTCLISWAVYSASAATTAATTAAAAAAAASVRQLVTM